MYPLISNLSCISFLQRSLQSALSSSQKLITKQHNILMRACTKWCLSISSRPGEDGLMTEVANKLVTRYSQLAAYVGYSIEKTVNFVCNFLKSYLKREIRLSISWRLRKARCMAKREKLEVIPKETNGNFRHY